MGFGVEAGVGCLHLVEKARFFRLPKAPISTETHNSDSPELHVQGFRELLRGRNDVTLTRTKRSKGKLRLN